MSCLFLAVFINHLIEFELYVLLIYQMLYFCVNRFTIFGNKLLDY